MGFKMSDERGENGPFYRSCAGDKMTVPGCLGVLVVSTRLVPRISRRNVFASNPLQSEYWVKKKLKTNALTVFPRDSMAIDR